MHLMYLKKQKQKADKRLDFMFLKVFKTCTFKKQKAASVSILWILGPWYYTSF